MDKKVVYKKINIFFILFLLLGTGFYNLAHGIESTHTQNATQPEKSPTPDSFHNNANIHQKEGSNDLKSEPINNALDFDGTDDYVNCGTSSTLKPTSAITVEAWINVNSIGPYEGVVSNLQDNDSDESGYCLYFKDGKITWWLKTVNGPVNFSTNAPNASINTGTWNHIAGTYDGSYLRLYVNGIFMDSYATTGNIDWTHSPLGFYIGALIDDNENWYFDGKIDEVRIWNTARTETEIRQNMYRELPNPTDDTNLVAYYKFNETSGTSLADSKGSNTGTLTNMTGNEWETSSAMLGPKNALDFDGSNDKVTLPHSLYTNNFNGGNAITIEYWFRGTHIQSAVRFQNSSNHYIVAGWSDPPQFIISSDGATNGVTIGTGDEIYDGNWHHIACVWEANTSNGFRTYLDGVLRDEKNSATALPTIDGGGSWLGSYDNQEFMNGQLDEVRIWNDARTVEEIRENMYKSLSGNEANLIAYYSFDNTSGITLQDFSGNGYDGTLINMGNEDWVASSAFNTWLRTSSADWGTATNWSTGSVPVSGSNIVIENWSEANPVITDGTGASAHNLVLESGTSLTVESGGSLITTGTIINNGSISIEKAIPQETWQLIAVPNATTFSGSFSGDYLQSWDEPSGSWLEIVPTGVPMTSLQGYTLWGTSEASPKTYTFNGTPNTGNQSINITNEGTGGSYNGSNLLGNPYPSYLDWDAVGGYGSKYTWNGTAYEAYTEQGGFGTGSRYAAPMEGFFVVVGSNQTFTLTNAMRTHSSGTKSEDSPALERGIVLAASNGEYHDALWIVLDDESSDAFELPRDAWKLKTNTTGIAQLWSVSPDGIMAVDARPFTETIQLGFTNDVAGNYSINLQQWAGLDVTKLEDTKEQNFHDLTTGSYTFNWDLADSEDRFILHLKSNTVGLENLSQIECKVYTAHNQLYIRNNDVAQFSQMQVFDISGRLIQSHRLTAAPLQIISINKWQSGVYMVSFTGNGGKQTVKVVNGI